MYGSPKVVQTFPYLGLALGLASPGKITPKFWANFEVGFVMGCNS